MNAQRKQQREDIIRYGCANQLIDRLVCDIPEEAVRIIQAEARRGFEAELERQGQTKEQMLQQAGLSEEQFDKINDHQILGTIQRGLALDALADHLDVKVTDEDYYRYFRQIDPGHEAELEEDYRDAGRIDVVRESIRRTIATDWLVENATIKPM